MKRFVLTAVFLMAAVALQAQQVVIPRPSPKATVTQTVGVTDIMINYCRPAVKGREIWGKLVPYGEVWRTGANENTSITFTDDVRVEGNKLPAGTYGIQTIPTADAWTVIFSKDAKVWGTFNYKPENDALKINVKPQAAEFVERMRFSMEDVTDSSALVVLQWEKLKISFRVDIETQALTLAKARNAIAWQPAMQAATYCLDNTTNLDEAMKWIDVSIALNENYSNLRIRAQLLDKFGKRADAMKVMEKALDYGKKLASPPFDIKRMEEMLADWKKKK